MPTAMSSLSCREWHVTIQTITIPPDEAHSLPGRGTTALVESMSMKEPFILVVFCLWALTGCGKKDTASAQNKSQPTPEQAAQIESEYILPANKAASATP